MNLPDFLVEWPFGEIVLKGHRIGLYHVVLEYKLGGSAVQVQEQYPSLSLDLIHQVLSFYQENQAEVEAYCRRQHEEMERQRATTPRAVGWDELRQRLEAKIKSQMADLWR